MRLCILSIAAALSIGAAGAATIAASSFGAGNEGWAGVTADPSVAGFPLMTNQSVTFNATGGNPGGFISITDPDGFDTLFSAPSAFLGDLTAALNGTLQYDTITDQSVDYNGGDVVIKGNGVTLVYDIPPPASASWSTVSVMLAPNASWHVSTPGGALATLADFQSVLPNVSSFWITAEYHFGATETTGLDNVMLSTAADVGAVPEPGSILLAGLGLCFCVWLKRTR